MHRTHSPIAPKSQLDCYVSAPRRARKSSSTGSASAFQRALPRDQSLMKKGKLLCGRKRRSLLLNIARSWNQSREAREIKREVLIISGKRIRTLTLDRLPQNHLRVFGD